MKRRIWNPVLLAVACGAGLGPSTPIAAQAPGPDVVGKWGRPQDWNSLGVHMILLKNGKVLCVNDISPTYARFFVFDPAAQPGEEPIESVSPPPPPYLFMDIFCSGHAQLPDGRILFVGGGFSYDQSHAWTVIFDPDAPLSAPWTVMDEMPPLGTDAQGRPLGRRWYPTVTTRGDGTVFIMSGGENNAPTEADVPLIFDQLQLPATPYVELPDARQQFPWYPLAFQLRDGNIFNAGSHYHPATLDPNYPESSLPVDSWKLAPTTGQQWTQVATSQIKGGSAVMYGPDLVMKAGGGLQGEQLMACGTVTPISNRAMTIDLKLDEPDEPSWTEIASMNNRRIHFYLIVLPDGKVLALGGTQETGANGCADPVLQAELYDPGNPAGGWQPMASMDDPRTYHSSAVLLPDARVVIAGGGGHGGGLLTAQIFSPPYLSQGPRPTITGTCPEPETITYGVTASVMTPEANQVTAVSLIRLGSATHSFDFDQRFLDLGFAAASPTELSVSAPATSNEAPPGYYMLFILVDGVPSEAKIVRLAVLDPPTAPTDEAGFAKHRVISIVPRNPGDQTAIRVTHTATGFQWWVGPPVDVTENSSKGAR